MTTPQLEETIYSALIADTILTDLLPKNNKSVFHLQAPSVYPEYPIIVYSPISDVPVLHGDNAEKLHRVTMRIHIVGGTPAIYESIRRIMCDLGFTRTQTTQFLEDGRKIQAVDFKIITEVL